MRYKNLAKKVIFSGFFYQHFGCLKRLYSSELKYVKVQFIAGVAGMEVV